MKNLTIHLASVAPMAFYHDEPLRLPALEILCHRGSAQKFISKGDSAIFEAVGMRDISYARQRLMGEENRPEEIDSGYWYCADPVNLKADRDQVILSHPTSIGIQQSEAGALISAFNQLFRDDGIQLWCSASANAGPERWYLRSEQPLQLTTTP
ncbi:MAG: hypothetical protein OQK13_06180, partial [Gammaproteobacteria bacterium]|nr:hypothetical protein [Gammaproteobacteria bacterium]